MAVTLDAQRDEARRKAWDSLARYKFMMFGYWAGVWVHLNNMAEERQANPFAGLVHMARNWGGSYPKVKAEEN